MLRSIIARVPRVVSRLLTVLLALGLVLAGCGTEQAGDTTTDGAVEEPTTGQDGTGDDEAAADGSLVAAAVEESAGFTTARTRFTSVVTTPQGDVEVNGEGVNSADAASITMTMSGQTAAAFGTDQVEMEVRILDGVMYQRFPQLIEQMGADAEWLSFDLATLGPEFEQVLESARQADPSESLAVLRDLADVTEVGAETVNGVETTHYAGQLDLRASMEASGVDPATMEGSGIDLDQPVPVDVWIDDDGLVRRYEMSMETNGMTTTTTFEVLEYGIDVEVTAPPADATVDFEELMEQGQIN